MKKYVVTFAHTRAEADSRVRASLHKFDTLKEAREYADEYQNAYIAVVDNNGITGYARTRADLRIRRKNKK